MHKTIIPIGFVIDKSSLIGNERDCYLEILGLMGFDTATGKYVNCGLHRYDDRVIFPFVLELAGDEIKFSWDSVSKKHFPSGLCIENITVFHIDDNNCPLFDIDGTYLDYYENNLVYFSTSCLSVEFNVETLSYSVSTSGWENTPDLVAVDTFGCDSQDIVGLFEEVSDHIYYLDGICIVTSGYSNDSLILPNGTEYLFIYGSASSITSLVCSKELLEIYCIQSNGIANLKRLVISKSITKEQFAKITFMIAKFNYKTNYNLSAYYSRRDWDGFYEYATKNPEDIDSVYEGIEIVVY